MITGGFICANLLDSGVDLGTLVGKKFDLIIASECMLYFTNQERDLLCGKFDKALNEDGVVYVSTQTYDMPMYKSARNVKKDNDGMVIIDTTGSIKQSLTVNLPYSTDDFSDMYSSFFDIIDVIETDNPFSSNERRCDYHLIAKKKVG